MRKKATNIPVDSNMEKPVNKMDSAATPTVETMSKIFLMEFIVDDLRLWKLPPDTIESDPAQLVFTYLDSVQVTIDKHEFDLANKNAGQNCLFTTDRRPTPETPVRNLKKQFY